MHDNTDGSSNLIPFNSLRTEDAEAGRRLAVQIAEQTATFSLKDATDTAQLMSLAHIVAIEFATIAAANDYWRDSHHVHRVD